MDSPDAPDMAAAGPDRGQAKSGLPYGEGARGDRQPRIIDLVPQRGWTLLVVGLILVTIIAGLETLYGAVYVLSRSWHGDLLAPLNLSRPDSLARWFAALLLILSAMFCPVIYSLRRFRLDDYRGRYRVWIAATFVLLAASLEAVAGLRRLLVLGLEQAMQRPVGSESIAFTILALAGAAVLVRLVVEMSASRLACMLSAVVACFYGAAMVVQTADLLSAGPLHDMLLHGALLAGHASVLLAILSYARHCHLDAHGRIEHVAKPPRKAKPKKAKAVTTKKRSNKAESKDTDAAHGTAAESIQKTAAQGAAAKTRSTRDGKQIRIDEAHAAPKTDKAANTKAADTQADAKSKSLRFDAQTQASNPAPSGPKAQATLNVPTADDEQDDMRGLSKSERRRLKKAKR